MEGGDWMTQAQQVWSMLDDMAADDPQAYRKFIDKQLQDGREQSGPPTPHMCVQTTTQDKCTFFINMCGWTRLPPPKTDADPIPVAGGFIYSCNDDRAGSCQLITIAFHPSVLEQFGRDSPLMEERQMLIGLAISYIQDQYQVTLSNSYSVLSNNVIYKGPLDKLQSSFMKKLRAKNTKTFEEEMLEKSFDPLASKDSLLQQIKNISVDTEHENHTDPLNQVPDKTRGSKPLVEEVHSENNVLATPRYTMEDVGQCEEGSGRIVITVQLPGISSVKECQLDISQDDLHLLAGDLYELHVTFPQKCQDDATVAQFRRKRSVLIVSLPVTSPPPPNK